MNLLPAFLLLMLIHSTKPSPPSNFNYTLDNGWPMGGTLFGEIAGVDVDKSNNVIIFHRGSHHWGRETFDRNDIYLGNQDSPIMEETIITIDPIEKKVIRAWGQGKFFIPHGLSLDQEAKNVWLTDCALHQVFKYSIDGSQELLVLGTAFTPGTDETHFCKPTSVADTGQFVFVADGYCNSRVVMFSSEGKYLGEFGQASPFNPLAGLSSQPTFYVPHKIVYAREADMLCVADRENGRIQCFSFLPKPKRHLMKDDSLIFNKIISPKFIIADPLFNGRLFSVDYSPIRGGILTAVSGESLGLAANKPPLGFVYNVTSGQLLSTFSPPQGKTFGMAHDLAITGGEAESLFVVDITPVNLWKFSRPVTHTSFRPADFSKMAGDEISRAMSALQNNEHDYNYLWYIIVIVIVVAILVVLKKTRKMFRHGSSESLAGLYSNRYSSSINSLFGNSVPIGRMNSSRAATLLSTTFSRRAFYNLFSHSRASQNDFSRIPLEDSDNSDDDKSDSDIEEFNINQANTSIKINV